ncbi:hypothetical protein ACRRTK_024672 [Alexandromys fortis]
MLDGDLQWGDNKWPTLPHTIPHHFQCLSCSVSYHTVSPSKTRCVDIVLG